MTLQPKDLARITIIKEAPDPNPNFCHKRSQTSLFFIQIHTDVPGFPILRLPSIGVRRPHSYNEVSNKEHKHLVTWTPISTLLTATTVGKIDLRFLCGIPWQLSIKKSVPGGGPWITGWPEWGGMGFKAQRRTMFLHCLRDPAPRRSATLTNMQSVVSHHRNYQRS